MRVFPSSLPIYMKTMIFGGSYFSFRLYLFISENNDLWRQIFQLSLPACLCKQRYLEIDFFRWLQTRAVISRIEFSSASIFLLVFSELLGVHLVTGWPAWTPFGDYELNQDIGRFSLEKFALAPIQPLWLVACLVLHLLYFGPMDISFTWPGMFSQHPLRSKLLKSQVLNIIVPSSLS